MGQKVTIETLLVGTLLLLASPALAQILEQPPVATHRASSELLGDVRPVVRIKRGECHSSSLSRTGSAKWTLTLENTGNRPVGNIVVETFYFGRSGALFRDGGGRIAKVIPPHSQRTFQLTDGEFPRRTARVAANVLMIDYTALK